MNTMLKTSLTRTMFFNLLLLTLMWITASVAGLMPAVAADAPIVRIQSTDTGDYPWWSWSPATLTVHVGEPVTFINDSHVGHEVESPLPGFHSPLMQYGESWTHHFDSPGEYSYICHPHAWMVGKIIVLPADQPIDSTSPASITDLATTQVTSNVVSLRWTTPGDDGMSGKITQLAVRFSATGPIVDEAAWNAATQAAPPVPARPLPAAGGTMHFDVPILEEHRSYWFAVRSADEVPNWSAISNSVVATTADSGAQSTRVLLTEYHFPPRDDSPYDFAPWELTPHGDVVWMSGYYGGSLGRLDPQREQLTRYKLPSAHSGPVSVIPYHRQIFVTDAWSDQIGVLNLDTLNYTEYDLPEWAIPGIGTMHDGMFWFAQIGANKIAQWDWRSDQLTEFQMPTPNSNPRTVVVDEHEGQPGFDIWVNEYVAGKLAHFNFTAGTITEYKLPGFLPLPYHIVLRDGYVWYAERFGNQIGRFDPRTETVTLYALPTYLANPRSVLAHHDLIYFTENTASRIGVLLPDHAVGQTFPVAKQISSLARQTSTLHASATTRVEPKTEILRVTHTLLRAVVTDGVTELLLPNANSFPTGITAQGNAVWFGQGYGNRVGVFRHSEVKRLVTE